MCGLAGAFALCEDRRPDPTIVAAMTAALRHRGPDDVGHFDHPVCALGHRRLSIIDLSPGGRQPMASPCGRYSLVYNGEIYNFPALRRSMEAEGEGFETQTDSEILLRLFMRLGPTCATLLRGMFAFAIVDLVERRLYLCRDRAGEKPLYYAEVSGILYFASEIKSFWHIPNLRKSIDHRGFLQYFAYTQPRPPFSLFQGVHRLPPGHVMTVCHDGSMHLNSYWKLDFTTKTAQPEGALLDELEALLSEAVHATTVSDRPIGLLLSGGLDSSLTRALLSPQSRNGILYFTVAGEREPGWDSDLQLARRQAQDDRCGHEIYRFDRTEFSDMREALERLDEPLAVYDGVISFFHSRAISRQRQVVLTGSGADELFAGYASYLDWADTADAAGASWGTGGFYARLADDIRVRSAGDGATLFTPELARLGADLDWREDYTWLDGICDLETPLDARLASELFVSMSHCASMFDTVGMASAVEYRSAFFDPAVMQFAASLPDQHRVGVPGVRVGKRLLRRLGATCLYPELISRPKTGYSEFLDPLDLAVGPWQADILKVLDDQTELFDGLIDVYRARTLVTSARPETLDVFERRRFLKLVIFLAWVSGQTW